MDTQTSPHITIGAVARRAGVGIDTIRYYERENLLPPPRRRASGYRDYGPDVVERLRFIRRAKALGFTLEEIRELLALSTDRERGVKTVKQRGRPRLLPRARHAGRPGRGTCDRSRLRHAGCQDVAAPRGPRRNALLVLQRWLPQQIRGRSGQVSGQ